MTTETANRVPEIRNATVLVTGGAGFIGSNIVEKLLRQDNHVVCFDNFSTGKHENISPYINNPSFKLVNGDIRNPDDCREAARGCEIVLHQAALGSVPRSMADPATTNEVNISGFVNVLIAARDVGAKRVVYASSSSVYGDNQDLPKVEDKTGSPLSPYAVTKHANEVYATVFASCYKMEIIGLRYFNVFGRRQDPHGAYAAVIPLFIKSLLEKKSPVINGDGTNSRDFTYIDNVIQAIERAAITTNSNALNTVYNVACGSKITLNQLYEAIKIELMEFDKEIERLNPIHGPERAGDIPHSLASIEKAVKLLNYSPTFTFQQGMKETIKWYVKNIAGTKQ